MKLVPLEPTQAMFDAGYAAAAFPRDPEICAAMYRAMVAAAPDVICEAHDEGGAKLRRVTIGGQPAGWAHWCPGCEHAHIFYVEQGKPKATWTFNGVVKEPTFSPSMRIYSTHGGKARWMIERTDKRKQAGPYPDEAAARAACPHDLWQPKLIREGERETTHCHYHLTKGVINFLADSSSHQLRGHVPLPDFPVDYHVGGS